MSKKIGFVGCGNMGSSMLGGLINKGFQDKENFIVEWQGRQYEIYYPDFLGYKKDFIKLKCKEVL